MVECLYDDSGKRVRTSYVEVAEECWGSRLGGPVVHIAQMIELLMTDILYVVLCGDLLEGSFPTAPMDKARIFASNSVLPHSFFISLLFSGWLDDSQYGPAAQLRFSHFPQGGQLAFLLECCVARGDQRGRVDLLSVANSPLGVG